MDKAALRKEMIGRLAGLRPLARALEEELVTAAVQAAPRWQQAATVAVYRSMAPEFSTVGLVNAAWRTGKRIVFPRIEGKGLQWHEVASWSGMVAGRFDIPAPPPGAPRVEAPDIDVWIVPGVAFTPEGHRLGRGGGYYDRALAGRPPTSVAWGVAFDCQLVEALPLEAHDLPVDQVWHGKAVTP